MTQRWRRPPTADHIAECVPITTERDAHVLAAGLECKAAYLLTLNRRHLLSPEVLSAVLPVRVMTPGEFLKGIAFGPVDDIAASGDQPF